jgi:hypothetical protein
MYKNYRLILVLNTMYMMDTTTPKIKILDTFFKNSKRRKI